ncbi:MAG: helix-turn-helix transcriptional regulator [Bacteroidaceae bacterium]|nr:helix-turn-helix transcriptional regulator [Bacteroidaceae bacterium]
MRHEELLTAAYPTCPIRNVLARIGDKWALVVLYELSGGIPRRFSELQHSIADISRKMLTQTLRTLEEDGLVSREVYAEVPPRVEYALTTRGLSLMPHLTALIGWAKAHMSDILEDRRTAYGE